MVAIRDELESSLLMHRRIIFASVGFLAEAPGAVLVSVGTERPDLLQVEAEWLARTIMECLLHHAPECAWNPDIHILKGRVRG